MGEEVKMSEYETNGHVDEDGVLEWEVGLPSADDITPLSQLLIPPELASAFSISPEPSRTIHDVNRASQSTLTSLSGGVNGSGGAAALPSNNNNNSNFKSFGEARSLMVVVEEEEAEEYRVGSGCGGGSDSKKSRKTDWSAQEAESAAMKTTETTAEDDPSARTLKRPRLVWTPQLHKRFVDVVAHLGIKNAVPKTIMQLMNVEGLTRENVASHLQKYRLYLKRMQGLSSEGPSSSDHLFASTPVPPQSFSEEGGGDNGGLHGNGGHMMMPLPVPYAAPMMPVPVYGHTGIQVGSQGPMGYHHHSHDHYHRGGGGGGGGGLESNPYMLQQREWSRNKYSSVASYAPVGGGSNRED